MLKLKNTNKIKSSEAQMPINWKYKVLKCWKAEILKCWNAEIMLWNIEIMRQWNYEMMAEIGCNGLKYAGVDWNRQELTEMY